MSQMSVNMEICDGMNLVERAIKKGLDTIFALLGLGILSPVFLLVYILLKKQGDGPVLFRQERIGYKGKPFYILKFRTMRIDSEKDGKPCLAKKGDERRYFIDLIRKENPDYDYIYLMRPGLTSMATLYNGYTDSMQKMLIRLQMDLEYLQQRSLFLDVKIVLTTIVFILKGKKF